MIHDVIDAVYKGEYRIELKFDNGKIGVIDFQNISNVAVSLENLKILITFLVSK